MKSKLQKLLSLLLVLAMLTQILPAAVFATEEEGAYAEKETAASESETTAEGTADALEESAAQAADAPADAPAEVLFEEASLREETVKQFRMSDGSYVAVQYDTPVHYQDGDGAWQDIDNTLRPETANDAQTYSAQNGEDRLSFAASLADGSLFATSFGGYGVQMSLYGQPEEPAIAAGSERAEAAAPAGADKQEDAEATATEDAGAAVSASVSASGAENSADEAEPFHADVAAQLADAAAPMALTDEKSDPFIPETLSSTVLYANVYDGVDLQYEAFGYNVKESILVNRPLERYHFAFAMRLDGLTPVMQEDGSILLVNAAQEAVYEIPAPYLLDAAGAYSDAAAYTLEPLEDGRYLLRVEADAAWMNAAQFPVAIDPTIVKKQSSRPISWGGIFSGKPNTSYASNPYIGYTSLNGGGEYQILAHVNGLPTLPTGSVVTNAQLNVRHQKFSNDSSVSYMMVEAHRLTLDNSTAQTDDAWLSGLTWNKVHPNGAANYDERVEDFVKLTPGSLWKLASFDLTRAVRDWYADAAKSRTLLLKSDCTATKRIAAQFATGSEVYFTVTYRNDYGIENYYTYQTQSAGRAGTGYLSDHMQQLAFVTPVVSSASDVMPFSLSLVYNSAQQGGYFGSDDSFTRDYRNMKLGSGWKLSAQQCVQSVRLADDDNRTLYWVYTDGDGTRHYFYEDKTNVFKDEDGLGLTIELVGETGHTNFKLTDDYGNETFFRDGILTYTKDAYGNGLYYCYNGVAFDGADSKTWQPSNTVYNRLTSVVRLNFDGSAETVATLVYTGDKLTAIYDEAGRATTLTYAADPYATAASPKADLLTGLTYPDGVKAEYAYDASGLTEAYDCEAAYGICYTYQNNKVNQFYEYYRGSSGHVIGNIVSCWNGRNRSSYRDWGADHKKNTADDLRAEIVFDNWGRTVCTYTTNSDSTEILGSSAASYVQNSGTSRKNNRTLTVGSSGMTAVNLLEDGGIEKSTDRWTSASTANCSAAARTEAGDANRRHGTGGLNLYLSSSATASDYAGIYRTETLTKGKTYTLSAYFSVSSYLNWKDGAKLELLVQNGSSTLQTFLLTDTKPSAEIESGWQRVSATYTPASDGTYRFLFRLSGCTGTAYLDDVQLEQADAASTYNLIQNGSFEFGTSAWDTSDWQTNNAACAQPAEQRFGTHAARITGKQDGRARVSQRVTLNCSSDTTFLLSGWALAQYAAPNPAREFSNGVRYFGLIAEITYSDDTSEWQSVPFEWSTTDWQCAVGTIVPKQSGKTVSHINVYCAYDFNSGTVWFDNIALRQEPVQTYRYDEKGNVTAATQTGTGTENAQYDSNGVDLLQYTAANGTKYSYEYNNAHDVTKTTVGSLTATTSYNKSGNTTGARLVGKDSNENASLALQSSATPTADRKRTASVTDANGSTTSYTYNGQTELLTTSTNAAGRQTTYEYYLSSGRAKSTYQSGVAAIGYTYSGGRLSQLDRKTYRSGTAQHQYYNFAYNVWGQTTTTKVGSRTLSTNTYYNYVNDDTARGGNLKSTTYANGDSVSYTYDRFDRLVRKSYNSGSYVAYTYNAEGSLARLSYGDSTGELASYRFEYDSLGRLIRSAELDADGGTVQRTEHIYDGYNRLSRQSWTLGGKTYSESYVYDDPSDTNKNGDGALTQMTTATGAVIDYQYDTLRRLTRSKVALNGSTVYTTAYAFRDLDASRTTTQVQYRNVRSANGTMLEGKKYTYDALGNITRISQSTGHFYPLVAYEYDAQNQLTKETYYNGNGTAAGNITRTISYTYDTAGNILSVTETAGDKTTTKAYTYGDSEWLDLLTAINGSAIRYDAGGNPTNWNNGKADLSLQWANGRRLTGASSESARKSESLSYAYDADGVRTSKSYTVKTYNVIPDYVVTFVADGKTVKTMTVERGYKLKDSDYPTVPAKTGYTGEWKKYTTAISTDVTVVAVYTKIAARHTVTFKADGVVLKTMTVKTGYTLKPIDYPAIPAKEGYIGSWPTKKGRVIRADTVISAIYKSTGGGGITVPTRPSVEIMSVDEVEPIEAEAAKENAVAPQGTHLASTQTITHEYLTQSGKVMRETIKTNQTVTAVLDFIYDESGKPFAMIDQLSAQPNTYYYVVNLQGDVVKLIDQDGAVAAAYTYDAWGNILSQSGSMADVNPLRYRGYYYDSETGFYYLQSRYYDPATRRFINADAYTFTRQGFVSTNMFAYCLNNPSSRTDILGEMPGDLFDTMDDAAEDFGECYNGESINNAKEYGSYIYEVKMPIVISITTSKYSLKITYYKTKYSYTEPTIGESKNVSMPFKRDINGNTTVAVAHTHGRFDSAYNDERVSEADCMYAVENNVPVYVATPAGYLKKFDLNSETLDAQIISTKLMHDPASPLRRTKKFLLWTVKHGHCKRCAYELTE